MTGIMGRIRRLFRVERPSSFMAVVESLSHVKAIEARLDNTVPPTWADPLRQQMHDGMIPGRRIMRERLDEHNRELDKLDALDKLVSVAPHHKETIMQHRRTLQIVIRDLECAYHSLHIRVPECSCAKD